jgi:phosphoglycolate phosphatase-like HAD superfamily hydrolase
MSETKTIIVDFDGTIAEYHGWINGGEIGKPTNGVREALRKLKDNGYKIIIQTTRTNISFRNEKDAVLEFDRVSKWLKVNKIPYDEICLEKGKPIAMFYIDDRGIRFNGNWEEITKFILGVE